MACVCVWVGAVWEVRERVDERIEDCVVNLDYLCIWQVQLTVYCVRLIPAHIRCSQCSLLFPLIDICFLPYTYI